MISYEKISKQSYLGYIWIMISQFVSLIGSQIVSFAVIWYLTIETGSTLILSTASIANIVPMIIVSPIAGVIADRMNKNVMLIVTDLLQALSTFVLIILFSLGINQLWHIIALLAVRGICQGFQMPVAVAITSLMVPEDKIKPINSINQIFNSLLGIASPAIGAIVIANFTIQQIYWLDVFTFIPTAIILLLIRIPSVYKKVSTSSEGNEEKSSFQQEFKEGFSYIKTSGLSSIFALFAVANFIVVPVFALFPLLILDHHGGGATQYSWVEVLFQAGIIIGAILLMASKKKSSMKGVIIAGMFLSVVLLAIGLIPAGWFWLFFIGCFALGINLAFIDTQLISVLQSTIPKELQGRVFSSMFVVIKALNPLGLILWGLIGEIIPVYLIFLIAPSISLVVYFVLVKTTKMMSYGEKYDDLPTNGEFIQEGTEITSQFEPVSDKLATDKVAFSE
ncbi:MAG: MFS transporter [Promethearchaeota archaeon]